MFHRFAGVDFKNSVPIAGLELVAIEALGEMEAPAPRAAAEFAQQQRQELSFPVTIQLDDQQLKLKSGSSLPLQVGMSLTANIKLRKVSYLQLLLGEFQDKAESLQRL